MRLFRCLQPNSCEVQGGVIWIVVALHLDCAHEWCSLSTASLVLHIPIAELCSCLCSCSAMLAATCFISTIVFILY